ncbi:unnamed protein product (macronuclear) [Paramecium tetraurelia]|uniref:Chromosome undetermined scaffold_141, whole genome shotgun sequence n=1 Tax=Paramecium tetraurelia TaxID=5888 RepID=A0C1F2_PARTE|nr:uncharacterized protein GSPATT00034095001 [Paramecium tetraurelia]XP_001440598.1 uncharacterized protein GSPATT00038857001 [Paramecium tetraurelia]CAK64619.1 unnamed protein product [Paramecium tetraurelia]CAK73201.1 unnamed protein product [Paramecium tetraurelia]|eukprot:XP_001432017.1 hypothetical protein (macronuclear) [Paramecium tetraurelia strain d4-2]
MGTQSNQYSNFRSNVSTCATNISSAFNYSSTFSLENKFGSISPNALSIKKTQEPKELCITRNYELTSQLTPSIPPQDTPSMPPSITIPNESVSSSSETSMISSESLCEEKIPLALIIGQVDNGKTFIMRKIFDEDTKIELFQPILQKQLKYYFVDTSSFDIDSDYDSREEQINNYKELFNKYPNRVRSILIAVNFERTDLMKKKVQNINKLFQKFKNLYTIIVTKFHFSENVERDKEQLKRSFQYLNAQDIIFVGNDTKKEQLLRDLKQNSLQALEDGYEFNLADTFLQEEDENEQNQILNDLKNRFN